MLHRRLIVLTLLFLGTPALAQLRWKEGSDYQVIASPERVGEPASKIEVTEVFSYGCIYCYRAQGNMEKLATSLPADVVMNYVHASFLPSEAWPMFQRAYYAARELGIAEATHHDMFSAVWETGEIPLLDLKTGTLRRPLPTIDSAAKFYARVSKVSTAEFLKVANSAKIDAAMKRADALIKQWRVPGTPSLVVNGRYLVSNDLPFADQVNVVNYLVSLERNRLKK